MSLKFNLIPLRRIKNISVQQLDDLLKILEAHVTFDGSDIERVEYENGILHLYPPTNAQMTLGEEFQVHSLGQHKKERSLKITPFFEPYKKRAYLGLRIDIEGIEYVIHRIDKVPPI